MSALTSSEKSPVLRWRKLKADMHSPYERRHELYLGTAYIGVVEPSADGTYLARGQNGGPHETFSTLHLAKLCLEDYRSEEHTSELQSLIRNSYTVFCLQKKKITKKRYKETHKKMYKKYIKKQ